MMLQAGVQIPNNKQNFSKFCG